MYPLSIGLAIETRELYDEVQSCLRELPVRVVVEKPDIGDGAEFMNRLEKLRPEVVILDITRLSDSLEYLVRAIRASAGEPMVVAVHVSADPSVILAAMRAGVNEYLYPPLKANLRAALERRSAERGKRPETARAGGKTVGFFSAKGGCGATTIACHIAAEVGRQGQRVLLADLDMEAGMVGFLMKAKSDYSVLDALNNLHRLDTSYWKALVSNGRTGLEIITAPAALATKQTPHDDEIRHVLGFMRTQYDYTIIDLGRSLSHRTLHALEEIDESYMVTTLEVPALHQAKQIIQTLLDSGYGKNRLHLILNRVPKRLDVTPQELEKMMGLPIFGLVPDDYPELYECFAEGNLLPRNSNLGKNFTRLAFKLARLEEPKDKRKFSFFS